MKDQLHEARRAHIRDVNKLLTGISKLVAAARPILEYDAAGNPVRECMFCGGDQNCAPECELEALLGTAMDVLVPAGYRQPEEPTA